MVMIHQVLTANIIAYLSHFIPSTLHYCNCIDCSTSASYRNLVKMGNKTYADTVVSLVKKIFK